VADSVRWAIGTGGEAPTILLPDGCAEPGARRHAREHAAETGREVQVYRRTEGGDGWERHGDPARPPNPGYLHVGHYHPCNAARCAGIAAPVVPLADILTALGDDAALGEWFRGRDWPLGHIANRDDFVGYLAERFGVDQTKEAS
jgi:hypothetical protein